MPIGWSGCANTFQTGRSTSCLPHPSLCRRGSPGASRRWPAKPDARAQIIQFNLDPAGGTREEPDRLIRTQLVRCTAVITNAGIAGLSNDPRARQANAAIFCQTSAPALVLRAKCCQFGLDWCAARWVRDVGHASDRDPLHESRTLHGTISSGDDRRDALDVVLGNAESAEQRGRRPDARKRRE